MFRVSEDQIQGIANKPKPKPKKITFLGFPPLLTRLSRCGFDAVLFPSGGESTSLGLIAERQGLVAPRGVPKIPAVGPRNHPLDELLRGRSKDKERGSTGMNPWFPT